MQLKLKNVRLSYPQLFEAKAGPDGGKPSFSASFLMDKDANAADIAALQNGILQVAKEAWGENNVKLENGQLKRKLASGKGSLVKICLRDGSEKSETPGYGDHIMFFSARNAMQPPCVDRNPAIVLTKASGRPYAGCYVNVAIRLWAQDNNFGMRINAQLQTVQFFEDGEAFGDAPVEPTAVFENISGPGDAQPGGEPDFTTAGTGAAEDPKW